MSGRMDVTNSWEERIHFKIISTMKKTTMKKDQKATDEELERIKRRKMQEFMQRRSRPEFPDELIRLSEGSLEEAADKYPLLVVDCWAQWCPPCRIIAPIIEELAKDYSEKVVFGKLNVDESRKIAVKYNVMSIPTLLFFKDGKLADRIIGAVPKKHIERKLQRVVEG